MGDSNLLTPQNSLLTPCLNWNTDSRLCEVPSTKRFPLIGGQKSQVLIAYTKYYARVSYD